MMGNALLRLSKLSTWVSPLSWLPLSGLALLLNTEPLLASPGKMGALKEWIQKVAAPGRESADVRALISKGVYWYERYRFDLAGQSFSKALLLEPGNTEVLKWHGLTDLAKGDVVTAGIWLERLEKSDSPLNIHAIELRQMLRVSTTKRQAMAEVRYMSETAATSDKWVAQLKSIFDQEPIGLAAQEYYTLLARSPAHRDEARGKLQMLARRFPNEKRYKDMLAKISPAPEKQEVAAQKKAAPVQVKPDVTAQVTTPEPEPTSVEPPTIGFAEAQALSQQGLDLAQKGQVEEGIALMRQAVLYLPDYPWFRYDLAITLNASTDPAERTLAAQVMKEGLEFNQDPDMYFANALVASQQDRNQDALNLLQQVPREDWSLSMAQMDGRLRYSNHLDEVNTLNQSGSYNELNQKIRARPEFRAEAEIMALEESLKQRMKPTLDMAYDNSVISGSQGISNIATREIPLEVRLPLDLSNTLFFRADQMRLDAGDLRDNANINNTRDFGKLDTLTDEQLAQQVGQSTPNNYSGYMLGMGLTRGAYRFDLGRPVGDFPVQSWVGGVQYKMDLGEASLRIDLARRMVGGSVLSRVGAVDPVTGEVWGGARRNGLTAVYYQPLQLKMDFVGIARLNRITGENIPSNNEVNLQGILSRTVYANKTQKVEVGASLFLWSFSRNMSFYTFGQGGYFSPQAFGSLTLPITWTGKTDQWSWSTQLSIGASESRSDDALRYPGFEAVDAQVQARNGTADPLLTFTGGPGGGTSTGIKIQVERKLSDQVSMGGFAQIDRSEGFNPDLLQIFLRWTPEAQVQLNSPPEPVTPYSRF
ncbi:MAG: cellulose synthase subunit BcsC-related outer membrane protein [Limnobacter sp.]|nr:cellulose synthase subunit BcsC-related outer membrane protein [Limnobacter sp.]